MYTTIMNRRYRIDSLEIIAGSQFPNSTEFQFMHDFHGIELK